MSFLLPKSSNQRPKNKKNKTPYQRPNDQELMTLELPQGRNAIVVVVNFEAGDDEAILSEAPYNHFKALNFIFTPCMGPWTIAK